MDEVKWSTTVPQEQVVRLLATQATRFLAVLWYQLDSQQHESLLGGWFFTS
jgi:hypothetical protein